MENTCVCKCKERSGKYCSKKGKELWLNCYHFSDKIFRMAKVLKDTLILLYFLNLASEYVYFNSDETKYFHAV